MSFQKLREVAIAAAKIPHNGSNPELNWLQIQRKDGVCDVRRTDGTNWLYSQFKWDAPDMVGGFYAGFDKLLRLMPDDTEVSADGNTTVLSSDVSEYRLKYLPFSDETRRFFPAPNVDNWDKTRAIAFDRNELIRKLSKAKHCLANQSPVVSAFLKNYVILAGSNIKLAATNGSICKFDEFENAAYYKAFSSEDKTIFRIPLAPEIVPILRTMAGDRVTIIPPTNAGYDAIATCLVTDGTLAVIHCPPVDWRSVDNVQLDWLLAESPTYLGAVPKSQLQLAVKVSRKADRKGLRYKGRLKDIEVSGGNISISVPETDRRHSVKMLDVGAKASVLLDPKALAIALDSLQCKDIRIWLSQGEGGNATTLMISNARKDCHLSQFVSVFCEKINFAPSLDDIPPFTDNSINGSDTHNQPQTENVKMAKPIIKPQPYKQLVATARELGLFTGKNPSGKDLTRMVNQWNKEARAEAKAEQEAKMAIATAVESEPVAEVEPAVESEPVAEVEPAVESEPVAEVEPAVESEPVADQDTVAKLEALMSVDVAEPTDDSEPVAEEPAPPAIAGADALMEIWQNFHNEQEQRKEAHKARKTRKARVPRSKTGPKGKSWHRDEVWPANKIGTAKTSSINGQVLLKMAHGGVTVDYCQELDKMGLSSNPVKERQVTQAVLSMSEKGYGVYEIGAGKKKTYFLMPPEGFGVEDVGGVVKCVQNDVEADPDQGYRIDFETGIPRLVPVEKPEEPAAEDGSTEEPAA